MSRRIRIRTSSWPAILFSIFVSHCGHLWAVESGNGDPLGDLDELNTVLTPSRLKQPLQDSPASSSIITSQMIKSLGIQKIPEVLRLVPGMVVATASGNDYRVSYHGGTGGQPRRMQVLIDGASVYLGGLARVDWSTLPLAIEDIHRVEVIRNPAAASYGANAFQGVVNFITKSPPQMAGSSVKVSVGSRGHKRWRFGHGTLQQTFSIWGYEDDGYDLNFEGDDRRDGQNTFGARYSSLFSPSDNSTLDLSAGYTSSQLEVEFINSRQISFPDKDVKNLYLVADYRLNTSEDSDLRIIGSYYGSDQQQSWRMCYENILFTDEASQLYDSNPDYVFALGNGSIPSGGTEKDDLLLAAVLVKASLLGNQAFALNCGDFNHDSKESSYRLEAQHTWNNGLNLISVAGVGVQYISGRSRTFADGTIDARNEYIFYNAEYAWKSLTFNAGGMLEHSPHLDDSTDLSYRVAANWHIDSLNTLRLSYSNATRTPDLFESDQKWNYVATNLDQPVNGSNSRRVLGYSNDLNHTSEEIDSFEIAYLFTDPKRGLYFQSRYFQNELKNLNSSRISFFNFTRPPKGKSTLKGVELELRYSPTDSTLLGLGYAYLDTDTTSEEEKDLAYQHSGHIFVTHSLSDRFQVSMAYYGSDRLSGSTFNKLDLSTLLEIYYNLNVNLVISHTTTENTFVAGNEFIVRNAYEDATSIIAGIEYVF